MSKTIQPAVAAIGLLVSITLSQPVLGQGSGQAAGAGADAVVPFTINVPDATLRDLKSRLERTRFPEEIPGTNWDYGTDLTYLKSLITYWRDSFDWRAQEKALNRLPQFKTTIDGIDIHFIHQKSPVPTAMPLAMTHGWPGSIVEFSKVIGPLTDPASFGGRPEDAFSIVAISLPGFGFSGKPQGRGYSPERMAGIIATLMARLGYQKYGVQGGDWGGIISGVADPNEGVPPAELQRREAREQYMANERAYQQIQATKPQTLGFALDDSPSGLAAWIVEKFRAWCDCDGGNVESKFTKDELLTNITMYWATQSGTSSARIYYENRVAPPNPKRVEVPTACALFPKEISVPPRKWVEARYNLVRWTEMPRGGHFAALEQPELLIADVREFFRGLR
jgi:pimeloyl-ACP methyl ester carboxylesterase